MLTDKYLQMLPLACLTFALQVSGAAQTQIVEVDKAACEAEKGTQNCAHRGIKGDGNIHDVSVNAPAGKSRFLGGSARTLRQNLDNDFKWMCIMNPPQPPTVENSAQRQCTTQLSNQDIARLVAMWFQHPMVSPYQVGEHRVLPCPSRMIVWQARKK
jgi:hypothetical protein